METGYNKSSSSGGHMCTIISVMAKLLFPAKIKPGEKKSQHIFCRCSACLLVHNIKVGATYIPKYRAIR